MESETEASAGLCGFIECSAVFQDRGDLCFLMISHQPAVVIQVSADGGEARLTLT